MRAVEQFGNRLRELRDQWQKPPHKPVTQVAMDSGSVELF